MSEEDKIILDESEENLQDYSFLDENLRNSNDPIKIFSSAEKYIKELNLNLEKYKAEIESFELNKGNN
jgi:hypothetical protein